MAYSTTHPQLANMAELVQAPDHARDRKRNKIKTHASFVQHVVLRFIQWLPMAVQGPKAPKASWLPRQRQVKIGCLMFDSRFKIAKAGLRNNEQAVQSNWQSMQLVDIRIIWRSCDHGSPSFAIGCAVEDEEAATDADLAAWSHQPHLVL